MGELEVLVDAYPLSLGDFVDVGVILDLPPKLLISPKNPSYAV